MSNNVRIINNIKKDYPNMSKYVIYKEPSVFFQVEYHNNVRRTAEEISDDWRASTRSLTRTKMLVQDLVMCNDFELFVTFTFDPNQIDRYNHELCFLRLNRWLHSQKDRRSPNLKYLVIPELHKDGAIHFHALLSGFNGTIHDSGHLQNGRKVYNLTGWRVGFSTAVYIEDKEAVSRYITKYITKDMYQVFNKRRYFCSKDLIRPKKSYNKFVSLLDIPPLFKRKTFEDDFKACYTVTPPFADF